MPLPRAPGALTAVSLLLAIASGACARGRTAPAPPPAPSLATIPEALAAKSLIVPVQGVSPSRIRDTYTAARGGRTHDALDILAPRGTPVLAADHGRVLRLSTNPAGGVTIYQLDREERFVYYYAHLDRYHDGLKEGMSLRQGDVVGYVGTSGNAPPDTPHLHFQVMIYRRDGRYWAGEPVNPHPYFTRTDHRP
jgi:murein DD-endopeptidase MepM/ murein hydrolase activator NlpD